MTHEISSYSHRFWFGCPSECYLGTTADAPFERGQRKRFNRCFKGNRFALRKLVLWLSSFGFRVERNVWLWSLARFTSPASSYSIQNTLCACLARCDFLALPSVDGASPVSYTHLIAPSKASTQSILYAITACG